jgi:hypothetical protein
MESVFLTSSLSSKNIQLNKCPVEGVKENRFMPSYYIIDVYNGNSV